jgi:formylglycine-generating enzyme required for sulfatase activity
MINDLPYGVEFINKDNQNQIEVYHTSDHSEMVMIPPGTFLMGSILEDEMSEYVQSNISGALEAWFLASTPRHEKKVNSFFIDKYAVTNRQFSQFVEETGYLTEAEVSGYGWRWHIRNQKWKRASGWSWKLPEGKQSDFPTGPDYPVVQVTLQDAIHYCQWAGKRLPSEAEWEYACRAGTNTRFYWGDDPDYKEVKHYAWYIENSGLRIHRVGQKRPNAWGLYDMSGNVWEWVSGCYEGYPGATYQIRASGEKRYVQRGGAWYFHPTYLRSAYRGSTIKGNFVGFRCALDYPKTL